MDFWWWIRIHDQYHVRALLSDSFPKSGSKPAWLVDLVAALQALGIIKVSELALCLYAVAMYARGTSPQFAPNFCPVEAD
jgi:hypothetical protein